MTVKEISVQEQPVKAESPGWLPTLYVTAKRVTIAAACHIGYYTSTGVVVVHTPEIVGYLAKKKYGDGVASWYARHTFSAAITPAVTFCGALTGAFVVGLGAMLCIDMAEACGKVVYSLLYPIKGKKDDRMD